MISHDLMAVLHKPLSFLQVLNLSCGCKAGSALSFAQHGCGFDTKHFAKR
jgi:hypothetical protein